jgi:tctex1 domain-containing protein 2
MTDNNRTLTFMKRKTSGGGSSSESKQSLIEQKFSSAARTSKGVKIGAKLKELKNVEDDRVSRVFQPRVTRMFQSINVNRPRQSVVIRPVLKFKPSYRLESSNPFNPRVVEDILKKIVEAQMESRGKGILLKPQQAVAMCRSLSEEVLSQVKAKNYDRYRILVTVTAGEKFHQCFRQNALVLWDTEKDALASYVYERADIFVIANVYGVYYD